MGISSFILKQLAKREYRKNLINQNSAIKHQHNVFKKILTAGDESVFCQTKNINKNINYETFQNLVPVGDYESIRPYIKQISNNNSNVLTRGRPLYFAITSGTTSGIKYIPLTKEMMSFQTQAIKELLLLYAYQSGNYKISNIGMMFIQGSPELKYLNKMPYARLSGISARHIPFFLKRNRFPSMKTNSISPWGEKIKEIVHETYDKDMRVLGGIPPWVITYFEELLRFTNKRNVKEVFPNLQLYIHGGTSFNSYKNAFLNFCGNIDTLEVYPSSEGFFAYQNSLQDPSLLLLTNHGVFYEFISLEDFQNQKMNRIPLESIELNIDYVLIVSTVAGLWAYNTGDTIRFVSKKPYKILFSGRASQYCSAFGEHVIEKEVQTALTMALSKHGGGVFEFTVCPKINQKPNPSQHEWFVEFSSPPENILNFEKTLNSSMSDQNIYYRDLLSSSIIKPLKLHLVKNGGFNAYMKSIGKFGGQNKCPHLSNDRKIADFLLKEYVTV